MQDPNPSVDNKKRGHLSIAPFALYNINQLFATHQFTGADGLILPEHINQIFALSEWY